MNWSNLKFGYYKTEYHIEYIYKNGKWGKGKLKKKPSVEMNIAATCLNYGQECFEGLNAFRCADNHVRVFRLEENAARLNRSSTYLCMPEIPIDMFCESIVKLIKSNIKNIPPYESGGSLYIRPLLLGTDPIIGVSPSNSYIFIVFCTPVGSYYKRGLTPVDAIILDQYDRAAPNGSGSYKIGGNYASALMSSKVAKEKGFPIVLFLDPRDHIYFEEFTTSNFFAITKDMKYLTPDSNSILASITNKSLMQIAKDSGLTVEKRPIRFEEINNFSEVGACGTAVVITPIRKIVRRSSEYYFSETNSITNKIYKEFTDIQFGRVSDRYRWLTYVSI